MKFTIITHAEHKLMQGEIYAYEPYVREMNLWLKYVDEVRIVAPVSREDITLIECKYQFKERHPEPVEGYHDLELKSKSLRQAQTDNKERHSEQSEAISSNEQIASSRTPCLPNRQARNDEIKLTEIPSFDITSLKNGIKAIFKIPKIVISIYKAMQWADHIHLRCPGNIGLLGSLVQVFFPSKPKTVKYAGNWDPESKQPLSYRFQKWILSNTFLTKNVKVLVYGEWPNQSKNIVPFFTATYSEKEIEHKEQIATSFSPRNDETKRHPQLDWGSYDLENDGQIPNRVGNDERKTPRNDEPKCHPEPVEGSHKKERNDEMLKQVQLDGKIYFLFVGALTLGKQPLLSVEVVHQLNLKGYKVKLDMYGEGSERVAIETYIKEHELEKIIQLHGNAESEVIKKAYQQAHFLLFISKSEGWPKVVAEAMFWECLPITSNVSCIPYMLDNGTRGAIVNADITEIVLVVDDYIKDKEKYEVQVKNAIEWSRQYTLEKFEEEIGKLLNFPIENV